MCFNLLALWCIEAGIDVAFNGTSMVFSNPNNGKKFTIKSNNLDMMFNLLNSSLIKIFKELK